MNKISLTILLCSVLAFAQEQVFTYQMKLVLLTRDFANVEPLLRLAVEKSQATIKDMEQDRERNSLTMTLGVNRAQFDSLARILPGLATVASNNISSDDLGDQIRRQKDQLQWTRTLAADSLVTKNDSASRYYRDRIHEQELNLLDTERRAAWHTIYVSLSEDNPFQYSYDTDSWFSFINMPGIEGQLYVVEQPLKGRTMERYRGLSLRYMFTQGKSYIHLGVLKGIGDVDGDSTISDIFQYDFGTDFYPRHLGKGKRKYLNLYSGFEMGGMLLGSTEDYQHIFTLEAHVGVEILKLQYLIWDVHCGYLFPLDADWNRHLRGSKIASAFNFVF